MDQADVYPGIFGHRYGHIVEDPLQNPQRWPVTEHEYRHAMKHGKPVLIYLMHEDHPVTRKDVDQERENVAKLKPLKKELSANHKAGFFESADRLHSLVLQSLAECKKPRRPRGRASDEPKSKLVPVPSTPCPVHIDKSVCRSPPRTEGADSWAS